MPADPVQRRLAAILAADVAGYSRLMGADEEGTLAALTAHLAELIEPCIAEHRGRVVKTTGDGLLAEFASVVDAVRCAVAFQEGMAERNAGAPENRRIEFRIGVNLGDVIVQDDDVFGDGVNVAARLEGLAESGGIVVSGTVHEHVRTKVDFGFVDLGPQEVKNIVEPVRAYSVGVFKAAASIGEPETPKPLPLPDKPSIAVLAFQNMSGDPEQEYFSDGITEDIITALSRIRQFFVIARNTTFTYKGRAVDVQAVAREMGVRYVLEGSVRKAGRRVRISAQLIDGTTGAHLWAERYDRDLEDVFAVQDEITLTVVGAMQPELDRAEQERAWRKPPESLDAWDFFQQGLSEIWRAGKTDNEEAKRLLKRAVEIDPTFSPPHAYLTYATVQETIRGLAIASADELEQASAHADRAVELDDTDAVAHWAKGLVSPFMGDHELSKQALRRAIELNPSFADAHLQLGQVLVADGNPDEAIPVLETALRLSPNSPREFAVMANIGRAHLHKGEFDEAKRWAERAVRHSPAADWAYLVLLSSLGHMGRAEEARSVRQTYLAKRPTFVIGDVPRRMPYRRQEDVDFVSDGLRKAGLPE